MGYPTDHPPTTVKLRGALVPGRACGEGVGVKHDENTEIQVTQRNWIYQFNMPYSRKICSSFIKSSFLTNFALKGEREKS